MDEPGEPSCAGCSTFLLEPYIRCAECHQPPPSLCLHCFAKGTELDGHKSNHKYEVIKNDFSVLEQGWTAAEEIRLLDAVQECGQGNWSEIAKQVRTKQVRECERHYIKCYLENPKVHDQGLKAGPDMAYAVHPNPVIYKLCEDPPRPPEGSQFHMDMSGYLAARGDFGSEFDNYAELDLRLLSFEKDEEEIERSLKLAVVQAYNNCIKERYRRKRILRDYGLISYRKNHMFQNRYGQHLGDCVDKLRVFCRLLSPEEYYKYIESLHYEKLLRLDIKKLQELRTQGITTWKSADVYERLTVKRERGNNSRHMLTDVLSSLQSEASYSQLLHRQQGAGQTTSQSRRTAAPLDVSGLPGYEKLTQPEKELCSVARLVPESYLEFKSLLISECLKHGSLRLAQARNLIKIDVNKTRKVYDFLLAQGHIKKDQS